MCSPSPPLGTELFILLPLTDLVSVFPSPPILAVWESAHWFCCWICWRSTPSHLFWQIRCPQTTCHPSLSLISLLLLLSSRGAVSSVITVCSASVPAVHSGEIERCKPGVCTRGELPFKVCTQIFVTVYKPTSSAFLFDTDLNQFQHCCFWVSPPSLTSRSFTETPVFLRYWSLLRVLKLLSLYQTIRSFTPCSPMPTSDCTFSPPTVLCLASLWFSYGVVLYSCVLLCFCFLATCSRCICLLGLFCVSPSPICLIFS